MPLGLCRKEDNGPTINDRNSNGHTIFGCELDNGVPVSRCKCGRGFQTQRGLKIHKVKLVATAALTTKTSSLQSLFTTTAIMLRLTT